MHNPGSTCQTSMRLLVIWVLSEGPKVQRTTWETPSEEYLIHMGHVVQVPLVMLGFNSKPN